MRRVVLYSSTVNEWMSCELFHLKAVNFLRVLIKELLKDSAAFGGKEVFNDFKLSGKIYVPVGRSVAVSPVLRVPVLDRTSIPDVRSPSVAASASTQSEK